MQEIWGVQSLRADFGILGQKHRGTRPNLSGEVRNYLVNYSVPAAKWDDSGPKLVFFGLSANPTWLWTAAQSKRPAGFPARDCRWQGGGESCSGKP